MTKKRRASSAHDKRIAKSVKYMPDSELNFDDIPELTDDELKRMRPVGRPKSEQTKYMISFRIDPKLLKSLRQMAEEQNKPYQTLIHELLTKATKKKAA